MVVHAVRHLLAQRHMAVLICAAALLVRLLVPAGYMIDGGQGRIAITLCSGVAPPAMTAEMHGAMIHHGGMGDHGAHKDGAPKDSDRAEMPCAFAGLSTATTGAIDPVQLAALIAFVLAVGLSVTMLPAPRRAARLRPPLRGPPAYR